MLNLLNVAIFIVAVFCSVGGFYGVAAPAPAPAETFTYDAAAALHVIVLQRQRQGDITVEEITFASPKGGLIHGELVLPKNKEHRSGALFVHWLGDPKTTNLTEFRPDALWLAHRGCVALLIDAMWSQPHWYEKVRTPETDYADSIKQVVDLRRALDVLLSQPGIDARRIAYLGHDFGAMYGALLSGVDNRVRWYVLMAGNPSFEKWFTYGPKPKDPIAFSAQMALLDPTMFIAKSKAQEFFFQFANNDFYISNDDAMRFANAAPLPHAVFFYDSKHSLAIHEALVDRRYWLDGKLNSGQ